MRTFLTAALLLTMPLLATDADRDFSGKWLLDSAASRTGALGPVEASLTISQGDSGILCAAGGAQWSYALDGSETRKRIGEESRNTVTKWEGAALLINTLVSGPQNYTLMDRWVLSRDHNTLKITRQITRVTGETEGTLVFRREGAPAILPEPQPPPAPASARTGSPVLVRRPEPGQAYPGLAPDVTIPIGTRVLLALVNEISTKHAKDGDRVYLRTDAPVSVNGRVVIPRGADVAGTITHTKSAGHVSGKGELFIRFDSLTLQNGVQRDFQARPSGGEGKVEGNGKAADGRTVMEGAGIGAGIGAITRGLPGAGVGGVAGALAGVLVSRDQNITLRPGTHMEMVLDRDLVFHSDELPMR